VERAFKGLLFDGEAMPESVIEYTYRKEFSLSYEEYSREPKDKIHEMIHVIGLKNKSQE